MISASDWLLKGKEYVVVLASDSKLLVISYMTDIPVLYIFITIR